MQKKLLSGLLAVVACVAFTAASAASEAKQPGVEFLAPAAACMADPVPTASAAHLSDQRAFVPMADYKLAKAKWDAGDSWGALVALLFGAGGVSLAMTTLALNKPRDFELGEFNDLPVKASSLIYEGAAVGYDGTYYRALVAGDRFSGFADRKADNTLGAAGAVNVHVRKTGAIVLPVTSIDVVDIGKGVYASDDDTFTLTDNGTNSYVGRAYRFIGTGTVAVDFDAADGFTITEMSDASGGTSAATIAAISATYVQAEVRNAIATLAAKVNAILRGEKGGG